MSIVMAVYLVWVYLKKLCLLQIFPTQASAKLRSLCTEEMWRVSTRTKSTRSYPRLTLCFDGTYCFSWYFLVANFESSFQLLLEVSHESRCILFQLRFFFSIVFPSVSLLSFIVFDQSLILNVLRTMNEIAILTQSV